MSLRPLPQLPHTVSASAPVAASAGGAGGRVRVVGAVGCGGVAAEGALESWLPPPPPQMFKTAGKAGRLQPFLGNEALEQRTALGGTDGGDAEHEEDRRVRRR